MKPWNNCKHRSLRRLATTKNTKSTKKGTPSCAGGRGGGAAEGFAVACSVRPPGPGSKRTRPYLEAHPARVEGLPGADARRTRGGCEKRGAKVSAGGRHPPACPRACSRVRFSPDARRPRGGSSERQQPVSPLPAPPSRKSEQREELCQNARCRLSAVRCPLRAQRARAHDFPLAHFGGAPYNKGAMLERAFRSRRKDSV